MFESRRDEVAGYWRRCNAEDIRDAYSLENFILLIISRRTTCVAMRRGWGRGL